MAKILIIIPYNFYPPKFGGALRCFHLLNEASYANEVTLLTVQDPAEFNHHSSHKFPGNVTIESSCFKGEYKTIFNILPFRIARAFNSRLLQRRLFKKGNLYLLRTYPMLKELLRLNNFDVVIYENLESFSVLQKHIKRLSPSSKHIYDAHNVDSELWKAHATAYQTPKLNGYGRTALMEESKLHNTTDLCFCCSESDMLKLQRINGGLLNITVIPNGVDVPSKPFDKNPNKSNIKNILFCGTLDYAPNREGLLWFSEKIFPLVQEKIPKIRLTIIGKMNNNDPYSSLKKNPNINFIGPVEDVGSFYTESSVAIVPIMQGSGTRLKILEAMSFGNPVVATGIGAEGLRFTNKKEILIANAPVDFADAIISLIGDQPFFEQIRVNAYELVKKEYDWRVSGIKMNQSIKELLRISKNS